jgi:uncharacterized membrane protein YdbT with pleckstrin-like domain
MGSRTNPDVRGLTARPVSPVLAPMNDEAVLWKGSSSQVKNLWWFVSCLLVIPIPVAIWKWLQVKCRVFTVTSERLLVQSGVFNQTRDTLELYRVRDIQMEAPFWPRMFGLQHIHLLTTDITSERVSLDHVPASANLPDVLRKQVELCRDKKRVREIGIDLDPGVGSAE